MPRKKRMCRCMDGIKVLLVGGNGFIGINLKDEFIRRHIQFDTMDITDEDLTRSNSVMVKKLKDVTHVFLLASKIGSTLFNKTPVEPYYDNITILYSCINAIQDATSKYNRKYNVVWYSSSEIFGSTKKEDIILDSSDVKLNMNHARTLYSIVKLTGELLLKQMFHDGQISSLTILRLFNISGKHQRRGVVYDMIESAIANGKIEFSSDTTRTITSVKCMIDQTFEAVFGNTSGVVEKNITESENSILMEDLARMIGEYLASKCAIDKIDLVRREPDAFLQYRHTGKMKLGNINKRSMTRIIKEVLAEVKNVASPLVLKYKP